MLLAARDRHCLREIAGHRIGAVGAGSRERPQTAQEAADQAHRRYADERSQFQGLVKLWDALHQRLALKNPIAAWPKS